MNFQSQIPLPLVTCKDNDIIRNVLIWVLQMIENIIWWHNFKSLPVMSLNSFLTCLFLWLCTFTYFQMHIINSARFKKEWNSLGLLPGREWRLRWSQLFRFVILIARKLTLILSGALKCRSLRYFTYQKESVHIGVQRVSSAVSIVSSHLLAIWSQFPHQ